jgi:hypothetical protein
MGPESKGQARIGPGLDLGRTRPFRAQQRTPGWRHEPQKADVVVHEESHIAGERAAILSISLSRMSLPLPHWGQVVRSKPVSALSISRQVLASLGVSGFCLVESSVAPGSWR